MSAAYRRTLLFWIPRTASSYTAFINSEIMPISVLVAKMTSMNNMKPNFASTQTMNTGIEWFIKSRLLWNYQEQVGHKQGARTLGILAKGSIDIQVHSYRQRLAGETLWEDWLSSHFVSDTDLPALLLAFAVTLDFQLFSDFCFVCNHFNYIHIFIGVLNYHTKFVINEFGNRLFFCFVEKKVRWLMGAYLLL